MYDNAIRVYELCKELHEEIYKLRAPMFDAIKVEGDLSEVADFVYATREALRFIDEIKKDLRKANEVAQLLGCVKWTEAGNEEPIRTDNCIGSPKVRMTAKIPSRNKEPEAFEELMRALEIPEALWVSDSVRLHWPGFVDYLSELMSQGKQLPSGIDPASKYPVFTLEVRKVRDMDEVLQEHKTTEF